jgi:hypothetical protein
MTSYWPIVRSAGTVNGVVPDNVIDIELFVLHSPLTRARTNSLLWAGIVSNWNTIVFDVRALKSII